MSDTPLEFFASRDFDNLKHLNSECCSLERQAKALGMERFRAALFLARCELGLDETRIRGEYRRRAQSSDDDGLHGSPLSYRARPDGQDGISAVKDLSASASPATKEQQ